MNTPVETQEIVTSPSRLKVVRIPFYGSTLHLEEVPLVDVGPGGISKDECKDFEKKLGHIPDLRSYNDSKSFNWAHRFLVGSLANNVPKFWDDTQDTTWKRDYMLYLCVDPRAGFPRNQYLQQILGDTSKDRLTRAPLIAYGDAFVFRKEPKLHSVDVFERAGYTHMDQVFVNSAEHELRAKAILRFLLTGSTEGDVV